MHEYLNTGNLAVHEKINRANIIIIIQLGFTKTVLESAEILSPPSPVRTANEAADSGSVPGDLTGPSGDQV